MKRIFKSLALILLSALALDGTAQVNDFGTVMKPVANCESKYGQGQDSIECVKNISLYRESYRNWSSNKNVDYLTDAFPHWRKVLFGCPCATKNTYLDGEKMLTFFIENEKDPIKQGLLVDTLIMMFDRRIEAYGQACFVNGRKGTALMQFKPDSFELAYKALKMSFECTDDEPGARTIFEYFKSTILMVESGKLDTTDIIQVYDAASEMCQAKIDLKDKNSAIYGLTLEEIEKAFEPYATCDVLLAWSTRKLEGNCENADILRKIVKVLDKKKCTDNYTYRHAAECLYKVAPDSTSAFALARMKFSIKSYSESIRYMKDAAEAFKNPVMLDRIYLLMADAYYKTDNISEARNAALRALDYNPQDGQAYILIGDLYSNSAGSCKWKEIYPAYWAAFDAYQQAKNVDASVADMANGRMASMKSRFPSKADIFFHNLTIGDSFTVGCWINRTTTVRSSD